ncbi:DUF3141 domain-containing protein, partial [Bosea sp. (in: a-proteobacteria)]|uniref:DUF3141 domain-containing protein n=1 Tax=Bosea sp. (in: a-proteobacteria) TaxID=1871050 RepID=UPI002FC9D03C
IFSHNNPLMRGVEGWAEQVRADRRPAAPDNPFLAWQEIVSRNIVASLDLFRDIRDSATELLFKQVYGSPALQAALGVTDETARPFPPDRERGVAALEAGLSGLRQRVGDITPDIAVLRAVMFVLAARKSIDERIFAALRRLHGKHHRLDGMTLHRFKMHVREQFFMLRFDTEAAVEAIGTALRARPAHILLEEVREILSAAGPLEGEALARFERISRMFPEPSPARETAAGASKLHPLPGRAAPAKPAAARSSLRPASRRRLAPKK